jgi:LPXTG-motif cell wall-anchored protein
LPPTTTTTIKVLGVQLARTGSDTGIWMQLAGALLVLGGVLLLASDRRVWPLIQRR